MTSLIKQVFVDIRRPLADALAATGRTLRTTGDYAEIVKSVPPAKGSLVRLEFFKTAHFENGNFKVTNEDIADEYARRRLIPADLHALATLNGAEPWLADTHHHVTQWQDSEGRWCYAEFTRHYRERLLFIERTAREYHGNGWWHAGMEA